MNEPIDRRRVAAIGLAGSAALLAPGARADGGSHSRTLAAIAEQRRRFAEILRTHDHAALPALFTADTLLLPAGKPLVRGREAAVAFWAAASSDPDKRLRSEFDSIDTLFAADLAIEAGRATVFAIAAAGEQLIDRGKYIVVWKREDGRWKRHRDIYNSDSALA